MDRRRVARGRAGGGEGIQALRAKRALSGLGALAALGAVAGYAALAADDIGPGLAAGGGVALALLALGLAGGWGPPVQLGLALVVAEYAAYLLERGDVDPWAPLVAAALLASGEFAYTSIEPPARRTWRFSLVLVAGAAVVASLLLGAAGASTGGLGALVVGVVAAVGALALVARLAATAVRRS